MLSIWVLLLVPLSQPCSSTAFPFTDQLRFLTQQLTYRIVVQIIYRTEHNNLIPCGFTSRSCSSTRRCSVMFSLDTNRSMGSIRSSTSGTGSPQLCASFHSSSSDPDIDGRCHQQPCSSLLFRNLLIVFTEFIKSFLKYILCLMLIFQVVTAMLQDHCTIFYKGFRKTPILFILIHATNIPVTLRPPDVLPQPYPSGRGLARLPQNTSVVILITRDQMHMKNGILSDQPLHRYSARY